MIKLNARNSLIIVFILLLFGLALYFPKIYLRSNIYYNPEVSLKIWNKDNVALAANSLENDSDNNYINIIIELFLNWENFIS